MKYSVCIVLFSIITLSACSSSSKTIAEPILRESLHSSVGDVAQNIIFLVGDGMGLTQISSAVQAGDEKLNLERFKTIGLIKTSSSKEQITDSAAGATAFSIGKKTYNGAIGVDDAGVAHTTLLEELGNEGYATGLIATSVITHATPASYFAHQESREQYYEIAADMVEAPLTLFIGGGKSHFVSRDNPKKGAIDDRNIIEELTNKGVSFVSSLNDLEKESGRVGYFIADKHPKPVLKGRGDILPRSILPSLRHLQKTSNKGFFIMIEGSQIDWGGHANDAEYIISELADFDQAVGKALDFAKSDGNTLVVVTADHETGGFSLPALTKVEEVKVSVDSETSEIVVKKVSQKNPAAYQKSMHQFSTHGHTAAMVPVFAFGPGAEAFSGVYENSEIYHKMLKALGR